MDDDEVGAEMKIKYIVVSTEKVNGKKKHVTENGEMEWTGDWDNDEDHQALRIAIRAFHPGKDIMGYAREEDWDRLKDSLNDNNPGLMLH